ncbi:MAG: polysaccharide biosynthesis/export family protein [Paracoccaceae bacterium]|nr:polysaccharide biosynthesis/export family protein [Paracoccaceae bacterium]
MLVDVDEAVAATMTRSLDVAPRFFPDSQPQEVVIGTGDTLQISIVSSSATGFLDFSSSSISPISSTTLPPQTVRGAGTVNVPPVGRVLASGRTIQSFENFLETRLGEVLVEPSVIVELVDRQSARVNIVGEVGAPGRVPLTEVNTRLVDVISAAGGPSGRTEDLVVRLSRGGDTRTVTLAQLFESPRYNVIARPGDVLALERSDRKFTVLGQSGNQTLRFDEQNVTLAEALSQAGGIQSPSADRSGVFLYRRAPRDVISSLGADLSEIPGAEITTIFRFDFSQPTSLFAANAFEVADGDILYISDSVNEEVSNAISTLTNFVPAPVEFSRDAIFN